jgi:hypothetical protein
MALFDVLRTGVQVIAAGILESFKGDVEHRAWIGHDGRGGDVFADPATRRALIDLTKKAMHTTSGRYVRVFATLTFLDPFAATDANPGFTRENPLDPRDTLTLPDGSTAPIQQTGAFMDPVTSQPVFNETILGNVVSGS